MQTVVSFLLVEFVSSIRGYNEYMDWEKGEGQPFTYCLYGAACSEVEINCLTGDHKVITECQRSFRNNVNKACSNNHLGLGLTSHLSSHDSKYISNVNMNSRWSRMRAVQYKPASDTCVNVICVHLLGYGWHLTCSLLVLSLFASKHLIAIFNFQALDHLDS